MRRYYDIVMSRSFLEVVLVVVLHSERDFCTFASREEGACAPYGRRTEQVVEVDVDLDKFAEQIPRPRRAATRGGSRFPLR